MIRKQINQSKVYAQQPPQPSFVCAVCGKTVAPDGVGSVHRNHCPFCLSSLHLDNAPGDRAAACGGVMEPIAVWVKRGGEWSLVHRCKICGALHTNRIAADDNPLKLLSLAAKPIAAPPFPLDRLDEMLRPEDSV